MQLRQIDAGLESGRAHLKLDGPDGEVLAVKTTELIVIVSASDILPEAIVIVPEL
jgi:hypothetical protein